MIVPILASALVVDTATAGLLKATGRGGEQVREWYRTLRIGAYAMDVLSLCIGAYIAMRLVPQSLPGQLGAVVVVQMVHDLAFAAFLQSPVARGPLLTLFRRYADEMGMHILWADALMMLATVALAHVLLTHVETGDAAFAGAVAAYVGLLVVYSF